MITRILTKRQVADSRRATAHARRQRLRTLGIAPAVVTATDDAELLALFPTQLRLVEDIEEVDTNVPAPSFALFDEMTPDEAESLRLGVARLRGVQTEMRNVHTFGPVFGLGSNGGAA